MMTSFTVTLIMTLRIRSRLVEPVVLGGLLHVPREELVQRTVLPLRVRDDAIRRESALLFEEVKMLSDFVGDFHTAAPLLIACRVMPHHVGPVTCPTWP